MFSTLNVHWSKHTQYGVKPNHFHFRNVCTWDLGGEQCQNINLDTPTTDNRQPRKQQQQQWFLPATQPFSKTTPNSKSCTNNWQPRCSTQMGRLARTMRNRQDKQSWKYVRFELPLKWPWTTKCAGSQMANWVQIWRRMALTGLAELSSTTREEADWETDAEAISVWVGGWVVGRGVLTVPFLRVNC